ncbi:unnamed protein product [Rodentolepis nana]|uniref:Uncharacterized protein n=1 Tax=Rodentolepis nana TaxID=102285 RepID=A0A3P7RY43_RODNA|nr:unnamed protein product [Rodentolepis nana]
MDGHRLGIVSVDINKAGTIAASASLDNQAKSQKLLSVFEGEPAETWSVAFSPDSRFVATGSNAGTIHVIGVESHKQESSIALDGKFIYCLAYVSLGRSTNLLGLRSQANGRLQPEGIIVLLTSSLFPSNHYVPFYAQAAERFVEQSLGERFMRLYGADKSPDGARIAAGSITGIVSIVDLRSGAILPLDGHATPVRSVAFSHDGRLVASTADDKLIRIYDARDGRLVVSSLQGHSSWVVSSTFSPDSKRLATASADRTVRIWDIAAKAEEYQSSSHEDQVWSVRYNNDGSRLLSVGGDGSIVVYSCP